MKTYLAAFLIFLSGCTDQADNTSNDINSDSLQNISNQVLAAETNCYARFNKDSVWLQITRNGDKITGNYSVNIQGKDRNTGTLSGTVSGDTIIANYTFLSEGIESMRQVVFLKKDSAILEGFGPVSNEEGKVILKNIDSLRFDEKMKLKLVPCDPYLH